MVISGLCVQPGHVIICRVEYINVRIRIFVGLWNKTQVTAIWRPLIRQIFIGIVVRISDRFYNCTCSKIDNLDSTLCIADAKRIAHWIPVNDSVLSAYYVLI